MLFRSINLPVGANCAITINGVKDLAGNATANANVAATVPFYTINLARGGIASSSTGGAGFGSVVEDAIDGNRNGAYGAGSVFHSTTAAESWWQVDLQDTKQIGRVGVYLRTDCCIDRNFEMDVVVFDDADGNSEVWRGTYNGNPFYELTRRSFFVMDFPAPVSGRLVRVHHKNRPNWLQLAEVEVYAPYQGITVDASGVANLTVPKIGRAHV